MRTASRSIVSNTRRDQQTNPAVASHTGMRVTIRTYFEA